MKAVEITNNLREYLKKSDLNTFELLREEGSLQIDLENPEIIRELESKNEPIEPNEDEIVKSDEEEEIDDEELRMRFEIDEQKMQEEDEDELDEEDIEELRQAMKNMNC